MALFDDFREVSALHQWLKVLGNFEKWQKYLLGKILNKKNIGIPMFSYLTIFGYDLETNSSALVSMFSINYAILLFVLLFWRSMYAYVVQQCGIIALNVCMEEWLSVLSHSIN